MNKKKLVKICLDIIMAVILLLMYRKNLLGLQFHEVGGLFLCGLFLIHTLLNAKWVSAVGRKLFNKSLAPKTRLKYSIDLFMLLCVIFIAVSGIMISKVLFPGIGDGGMFWKTGHSFTAAILLVLAGIHIGLEWSFVKGMFSRLVRIPQKASKPLAVISLCAILLFGGYSMITSSFGMWISGPFTVQSHASGDMEHGAITGGKGSEAGADFKRPEGGFHGSDSETGNHTQGMEKGPGSESISLSDVLRVILGYGSILAFFAVIAAQTGNLILMRRKRLTGTVIH